MEFRSHLIDPPGECICKRNDTLISLTHIFLIHVHIQYNSSYEKEIPLCIHNYKGIMFPCVEINRKPLELIVSIF